MGIRLQRQLVTDHFCQRGATVDLQVFQGLHPISGDPVELVNLRGSWASERQYRVLIGVHGDTRPHADLESDPKRRLQPFLGANDGASGVSALMELARHLTELVSLVSVGIDLVVFDAEEFVIGESGTYCLGSRWFAADYQSTCRSGDPRRYEAALVLDLIAGRSMQLRPEGFSFELAPSFVAEIWEIAELIQAPGFGPITELGPFVEDDHLPLLSVGIPSIALVDLDYPQWHTIDDLPDACSPASLGGVGQVTLTWLAWFGTTVVPR